MQMDISSGASERTWERAIVCFANEFAVNNLSLADWRADSKEAEHLARIWFLRVVMRRDADNNRTGAVRSNRRRFTELIETAQARAGIGAALQAQLVDSGAASERKQCDFDGG